jgi:hypothetical protein
VSLISTDAIRDRADTALPGCGVRIADHLGTGSTARIPVTGAELFSLRVSLRANTIAEADAAIDTGGRESGSDAWRAHLRRATNPVNHSGPVLLAQDVSFS